MPKLTIDVDAGARTVEVPMGKRLVNALEDEGKVDQLHACGGNARCTTCRVEFVQGKPTMVTMAEKELLAAKGLTTQPNLRLSCQTLIEHDMELKVISRLNGSGRVDAGKRCAEDIMPSPAWTTP
jgi:ferredoxin